MYQQNSGQPYQMPQQRGECYPQSYQPFYPQAPMQQMQLPMISGRMVSSREEAAGAQMDFVSGAVFLPDLSHNRIYAKIFNPNTGEAPLREFRLVQQEEEKKEQYATAADLQALRADFNQLVSMLSGQSTGKHAAKGGSENE